MSETKHTPGPWELGPETFFHQRSDGGKTTSLPLLPVRQRDVSFPREVALVWHNLKGQGPSAAIDIANANLIATAPELLESARELVVVAILIRDQLVSEQREAVAALIEKAAAAIAKAEGR